MALKSIKSSLASPTPKLNIGIFNVSPIGINAPPLAVPSNFVIIKLLILQVSSKTWACLIEFWPVFPSSTSIISLGASLSYFFKTLIILDNSSIKLDLL